MITCCKDCKNRHLHCHSECGEYKEQKAREEEKKAYLRKLAEQYTKTQFQKDHIKYLDRMKKKGYKP